MADDLFEPMRPTLRFAEMLSAARNGNHGAWNDVYAFVDERLNEIVRQRMNQSFGRFRRWIEEQDAIVETQKRLWPFLMKETPESTRHLFGIIARLVGQVLIDFARSHYGPEGTGKHHQSFGDADSAGGPVLDGFESKGSEPTGAVLTAEVIESIEKLPMDQREAIRLHYLVGLTTLEVGEVLGMSQGSAHKRIVEGIAGLGRMFKENE